MSYDNPYTPSPGDPTRVGQSPESKGLKFAWIFLSSYGTSVAVAFLVTYVWLTLVHGVALGFGPGTPDVAQLGTLMAATIPSILTSLCFGVFYCWMVPQPENRKRWPAILFGLLSGSVFNVLTAITLIESLLDW
jgi:hypothetical protein